MELKAFNRWSVDDITVIDKGLKRYITIKPRIVPKSGATYASKRFHKGRVFIVERLINKLMVAGHKSKKHVISSGRNTGKALNAYKIVEDAFIQIELKTKLNPVAVFVKALENACQREETITIEYGGARYPKAVETSPLRRIDQALKYMAQGVYQKSFNKKRSAVDNLVDEILNAYRSLNGSAAVAKKLEVERQADSSR
jgi:small subunit ribosomal protein S7